MSSPHARIVPRLGVVSPYSYTLVEFVAPHGRRRHTSFATLPALAIGALVATSRAKAAAFWQCATDAAWPRHHLQASGPHGETFDTCELVSWGERLTHEVRPVSHYFELCRSPVPGYTRRLGPVPGIHKRHSCRWYRAPKTMNERRSNAGSYQRREPDCRPGRTGYALPSDRDDIHRSCQRCWKAQRKGRKAWDR